MLTHRQPIVTGTSVLGLRYKDGVMLATDTLASYGSLARFMDIHRLEKVSPNVVVGASGDMSDWQNIKYMLSKTMAEERQADDGHSLSPPQVYSYLARTMYNRRSKLDPLWNALVLGGYDAQNSEPFLGYVDLLGTTYQSSTIATGFGLHLAQPMLRKAVEGREDTLTEEEARAIIEDCMRVLCTSSLLTQFTATRAASTGLVHFCSHAVPNCHDHQGWRSYWRAVQRIYQLGLRRKPPRLWPADAIEA